MMKVLIGIILYFGFYNTLFAESYYFSRCQLTDTLYADYLIDLDKKVINVQLETMDGTYQEFSDPIELIEKYRITSKKIKSGKSKDSYFVYYLDGKLKSVIKQNYKKESDINLILFCN